MGAEPGGVESAEPGLSTPWGQTAPAGHHPLMGMRTVGTSPGCCLGLQGSPGQAGCEAADCAGHPTSAGLCGGSSVPLVPTELQSGVGDLLL